ncbi:hypothetical protein Tco_0496740 [Tanacetum coccineum]
MASQDARLSKFEVNFKQQQSEMTNKINTVLKVITDRIAVALPSDTVKNPKLNVNTTTLVLSARSYLTEDPQCSTHIHGSINTIMIHLKQQSNSRNSKAEEEEREREGDPKDTNLIAYNEERRDTPQLKREDITVVDSLRPNRDDEGIEWLDVEEPLDLVNTSDKFTANAYIDVDLPMNIMSLAYYNSIRKNGYRSELSSEGHDLLPFRVILSEDDYDRGCRKPSDLEGGFYRDTIKLGPEYLTGMDDEGEVT